MRNDLKKIKRIWPKLRDKVIKKIWKIYYSVIHFFVSFALDKNHRNALMGKAKSHVENSYNFVKSEAKNVLNKKFEDEALNIGHRPIVIGVWSSFVLLGLFFLWSITARINSTAIAPGKVILDEDKKKIQHLEGGIIEKIFVVEGERVRKDQPLLKLSETSAKANQELLKKQLFSLKAAKIRLEAERDGKSVLDFSSIELQYRNDPEIIKILRGESGLFSIRKQGLDERVRILMRKINQLNNEILALKSQESSVNERIVFAEEESLSLGQLYEQGIISRSRYLELKKQMSEMKGSKGEYEANISKVRQAINEAELEIANIKTEKMNEIIKELQETQTKIADLEERTSASTDILQRTIIRAPRDGIVNGLKFHTEGGVIPPGGEIMEIIPQDDELIVEVRVNPQDIDVVVVGLDAKVHLSAYRSKSVPLLKGKVINVSADSFQDQSTGVSYFLARVKIADKKFKKMKDIKLYPGMPVEAYIITGSRTFMGYLLDPITVGVRKSFREE